MKKTKVIAFAIAMSMMCMGAAYAWTNPVNVNVAASTAVFSVDISGAQVTDASKLVDNLSSIVAPDGKSMNFTAAHLYPGATAQTTFYVANTGTIDVKVTEILLQNAVFNNPDVGSNVDINVAAKSSWGTDQWGGPMFNGQWNKGLLLNSAIPSFYGTQPLVGDGRNVIHPGQNARIIVTIKLDANAPDTTTEGQTFSFNIVPNFVIAN